LTKDSQNGSSLDDIALHGRELDQLCRFSSTLGTSLDVKTLVNDSIDSLLAMAGATRMLIALAGDDVGVLVPVARREWDFPLRKKGIPASVVASLGTAALGFNSVEDLPESLHVELGELRGQIAVIPLWAHAHLRGVAVLIRAEGPFTMSILKLLTAAGSQLALATESSQLLSDLQKSFRKLLDTQEELIRSERLAAVGQLSATLAHEIRNPLATIFSAISQIRKHGNVEGTFATLLDIAEEEASRLNRMVSGLLDFARPREPSFEMRHPFDVVSEVLRDLHERDEIPRNVEISIESEANDLEISMDPDLTHRAVLNLISNAIWAVEEDGGKIVVKIKAVEGLPGSAVIEIEDNGVGIPSDVLSKVCSPFFSTKPSGTGLGLSIARRIAEDHGGTLKIDSVQGSGTTVQLLLETKDKNMPVKEDIK
jgi:signal transduction histidine kinase